MVYVENIGVAISILLIMTIYIIDIMFWINRMLLGVVLSCMYFIALNFCAVKAGEMQFTYEAGGEEKVRSVCQNLPLDAKQKPYECNFDSGSDEDLTGFMIGSNTTRCNSMFETLGKFMLNAVTTEKHDTYPGNPFVDQNSKEFETMVFTLKKNVRDLMFNWQWYFKFTSSTDATTLFFVLFLFTMMLAYPFFLLDYNERVCFNRLKVQERNNKILQKQFNLSELLLSRLLPPDIVIKLRDTKQKNVELAENYSNVTILFCDMVGFTKFSSELDPSELMSFLSELYARYAKVLNNRNLYTVEVIGDALLAVAGCPERYRDANHAARALTAAVELVEVTKQLSSELQFEINIRVGVHTGPVIAGVVGQKDPRYHLFGRTVKMAEIFESTGTAGRVHCSINTYQDIMSSSDSESIMFRKTVSFIPRDDLDDDQKAAFTKIGYVGDTFYCEEVKSQQMANLNYRRLTLGREGILGGMTGVKSPVNNMKGISESSKSFQSMAKDADSVAEDEGADSDESESDERNDYVSVGEFKRGGL